MQRAGSSNSTRSTIRIELPRKSDNSCDAKVGEAVKANPGPTVEPRLSGSEAWSEVVQRLEKGVLVEPAALATALYHEIVELRRRLSELESRISLHNRPKAHTGSREIESSRLRLAGHVQTACEDPRVNGFPSHS